MVNPTSCGPSKRTRLWGESAGTGQSVRSPHAGGSMAAGEAEELRDLLAERLALVNSDPSYEGAEPTSRDHLVLALIGLVIPAVLLAGGWVLYGS
jgi:hypothetical protein